MSQPAVYGNNTAWANFRNGDMGVHGKYTILEAATLAPLGVGGPSQADQAPFLIGPGPQRSGPFHGRGTGPSGRSGLAGRDVRVEPKGDVIPRTR